jgi:hypothetical protein
MSRKISRGVDRKLEGFQRIRVHDSGRGEISGLFFFFDQVYISTLLVYTMPEPLLVTVKNLVGKTKVWRTETCGPTDTTALPLSWTSVS